MRSELNPAPTDTGHIDSVQAFTRPFAPFHDVYQAYYHEALRRYCRTSGLGFEVASLSRFPRLLGGLRRIQDLGYHRRLGLRFVGPIIDIVGESLEGRVDPPGAAFHNVTGQYLMRASTGAVRRVCIDSSDSPEPGSPELVRWSDIYFKTNMWASREYAPRVAPLANCDPLALAQIPRFRALRGAKAAFDICFIVRVWGGSDAVSGIEHNLRLLQAVKRARCRKFVLAILLVGDRERDSRYLRALGVPYTTKSVPPEELWRITAASRLNLIRLGVHYCVPWRMTGSLAARSCVVLDAPPFSRWPAPLREGINYLNLGVETGPGRPVATDAQYDEIPSKIESWLENEIRLTQIGDANGSYFDRFLEPERLGAQILRQVERVAR